MKKFVFLKLSIMMFLQYMLLAVWWMQLPAYLDNLGINNMIWLIMSAMAFGSMAAPLVGMIADRYVSSEKLLAGLNLLVAVFLLLATQQTGFAGLMITITLAMLCYMPSWSLTSSIAMTHISSEQFPRIRLMGTFGWIASGIFSIVAIQLFKIEKFDGEVLPLYCGVVAAFIAALFNLFLPKTPPTVDKSAKYSIQDIFGLSVISTLKNKNFNRFILISVLIMIPFTLFYTYGGQFLQDENFKYITVTMNWRQVAELFFLFITTSVLVKFGYKKAMLLGLLALLIQCVSIFSGIELGMQWLYYIGIIPHGLIFGLFFVAGQVYTDKMVPQELKAQAQGFLTFVIWGLGILAGNLINGQMINYYTVNNKADWSLLYLIAAISTVVVMALFVLLFKNPTSVEKK